MNDCPRLPKDRRGKTDIQNKWTKQIESLVDDDPEFRNKVVHTTYRKIAFKNGYYDCEKKCLCHYNRQVYFLMKGSIDYAPRSKEFSTRSGTSSSWESSGMRMCQPS